MHILLLAVGAALVNNVILSQFLGLCPFLGVSKKIETAAGMGGAIIFVITISSFVTGLIYKFILFINYFFLIVYKRVPFSSVVTSSKAGSIAFTKASNHVWYANAMNLGSTPAVRQ